MPTLRLFTYIAVVLFPKPINGDFNMTSANIETITNLYLYGTTTKPENIEDRLRDDPRSVN